MAATRKEVLAKKVRLLNLALQLNQQANPQNFNAVSQSSSAYMELKKTEGVRVDDQAIAKMIRYDLAKADQTPSVTHNVVVAAPPKSIVLPMPFSVVEDAKEKIALDNILPSELLDLIIDYCRPFAYVDAKKEEKPSNSTVENKLHYKPASASFFSKNISVILHQAANDILDGSQAEVDRVVALVKNNPSYLSSPTEGRDRLGRRVQGTLLQIAAMAGDVNLRELKEEEKQHRGIVELLQEAGNLLNDDVAKQLHPVLFSEAAIKANEARNEYILTALKQFAESILQTVEFEQSSTQALLVGLKKCELAINTFRATLQSTFNDVVMSGYVFDTRILHQAMAWFEQKNNLDRFGGWWTLATDIFWVNVIGTLQCIASSRDAQVYRKGMSFIVDGHQMPERSLENAFGYSFLLSTSDLGVYVFLGGIGKLAWRGGMDTGCRQLKILMSSKNSSVAKFIECSDNQPASQVVITKN